MPLAAAVRMAESAPFLAARSIIRARGSRATRCQADLDAVKPLIMMAYDGRAAAIAAKQA